MTSLSFPKKISKRVSFSLDNEEFLLKPKPALVAFYIKGSGQLICSIKTASDIEEDNTLAFQSLKRSPNGWKRIFKYGSKAPVKRLSRCTFQPNKADFQYEPRRITEIKASELKNEDLILNMMDDWEYFKNAI